MPIPRPNEQDRANYSYDIRTSPHFDRPDGFLRYGQRVKANFRIWDQPNMPGAVTTNGEDWGWVSAQAGEEGTVVHTQTGHWPTVRFDSGCATCVTDREVTPLDE